VPKKWIQQDQFIVAHLMEKELLAPDSPSPFERTNKSYQMRSYSNLDDPAIDIKAQDKLLQSLDMSKAVAKTI